MTVQIQPKEQRVTNLLNAGEIYGSAEQAMGLWMGDGEEGST